MWVSWCCNDIHPMVESGSKVFMCQAQKSLCRERLQGLRRSLFSRNQLSTQKHRWKTSSFYYIGVAPFFRWLFLANSNKGAFIASPVVPWNQYRFIGIFILRSRVPLGPKTRKLHTVTHTQRSVARSIWDIYAPWSQKTCATQIVSISSTDLGIWVNMSNLKNASNNYLQYPLRFYFVFCAIFVLFGGFEYRPNKHAKHPTFVFLLRC